MIESNSQKSNFEELDFLGRCITEAIRVAETAKMAALIDLLLIAKNSANRLKGQHGN